MNMKSNSIEAIKLKRKQLYATYRHNQEKSWWISNGIKLRKFK